MERSFSQVLRWGMAGWCLVGELGLFFGLHKILLSSAATDGSLGYSLLGGRIAALSDPALMTVVLAALGVPLGYFIYQVYYFLFWTVPAGSVDPRGQVLIERLTIRCPHHSGLDAQLANLYDAWASSIERKRLVRTANSLANLLRRLRRQPRRTARDVILFRADWAMCRSAFLRSLTDRRESANVGLSLAGERFEYLTSMYDGLGAIMIANWAALGVAALFMGWRLAYVDTWNGVYQVAWTWDWSPPVWAALLVLLAIEAVLVVVFHRVIWTNRVLLRLSIVTLADSFICRSGCVSPECLDDEHCWEDSRDGDD